MGTQTVNRRLAAAGHSRQLQVSARADAAANAADRVIGSTWQSVLRLIRSGVPWPEAQIRARLLFAAIAPGLVPAIAASLGQMVQWGWRSAVYNVKREVPAKLLAAAAVEQLTESEYASDRADCPVDREHDFSSVVRTDFVRSSISAGTTSLLEDEGGQPAWELLLTDLLRSLHGGNGSTDTRPDQILSSLLFPAPTEADIASVIFATDWQDRLATASRLAPPLQMASILAGGLAAGKSQQQIARDLLPAMDGVRVSARRVARTECLRVAHTMNMRAHESLGDLVIGYTLHAVHDQHSRPWHWARNGRQYFKDPGPGQDGYGKMPMPPDEPLDASERPPNTPATAFNCRCFLSPILRPPSWV